MVVREYADFVIRPRLLTIPGVAQVVPIGGEVRQYQVQPDTRRMAALGISVENIEAAIKGWGWGVETDRDGVESVVRFRLRVK